MNWHARMIAADNDVDGAPSFRREFALEPGHGAVAVATLTLTALGVVEAWLNGSRVSPDLLTPGWTSYEWRVRYVEYDVTALVEEQSVLGLTVGNGWYRGRLGWSGRSGIYGDTLGAFAQLVVTFADGTVQVVATDEGWSSGPSAVVANDLYDGQTVDARRDASEWLRPGFHSPDWRGVRALDFDLAKLTPNTGPAVRAFDELAPVAIWQSPSGKTLVDFGANIVGFLRVRVQGPAGTAVVARHAEVLEDEELGTRPLRTALATDTFILSGGADVFEPTFTFHGFRYAEITGWPGELTPDALTAVVVGSELERTGRFRSSDPTLNQFHENVVRGMRGNFLSIPTDCPQRDERLGWTGDIAAFAPTAAYLFDVDAFLREWLVDVALEQEHGNDVVPYVVPDPLKYLEIPTEITTAMDSTAVWSDAAVWVPWNLYEAYGDTAVLEAQFESMAGHVRHVRSLLSPNGLWDTGFQFGDWLDPDAPPENPAAAKADTGVVATVSLYRSARIVADAARLLGRVEADEFAEFAAEVKAAFTEHYLDAGRILSDASTVYALAIVFGILDPADEEFAGARLAELVSASDYRISTGFAGTPFICDALSRTGHLDDAYRLLMQRECPSWLYPVTMGATTIWERWDSMLPDGSINPGQMTSFNHYALGAVADWMHRVVAGISPLEPGYREVLIAPQPGGGLTEVGASLDTRHGPVSVHWWIADGHLHVEAEVPSGVPATVRLPGRPEYSIDGGRVEETLDWP